MNERKECLQRKSDCAGTTRVLSHTTVDLSVFDTFILIVLLSFVKQGWVGETARASF